MPSYDHRIQCFGIDLYLLTWRSNHAHVRPEGEQLNAATIDRCSAESACKLYGLLLPDEPPQPVGRSRRRFRRLLRPPGALEPM